MFRLLAVAALVPLLSASSAFALWPPDCICNPDVTGGAMIEDVDQTVLEACLDGAPVSGCIAANLNCDGWVDGADMEAWFCMSDGGYPELCCPYILYLEGLPVHLAGKGVRERSDPSQRPLSTPQAAGISKRE